ncbi:MAG TPA: MASE1 domain-containing protein [Steroidobacteraceae bacterium]
MPSEDLQAGDLPPLDGASTYPKRLPSAHTVRSAAAVGLAYYVISELGLSLPFSSPPASMLWAPNAILLAALVLAGRKDWWVYLALALPAHLLAQLPPSNVPLAQTLVQYAVNCSTALIGAFALTATAPDIRRFNHVKSALVLIAFAAVLGSVSTSVLMAAAFVALAVSDAFWTMAIARTLINAFAILTVVPLILHAVTWQRREGWSVPTARSAEACLLAVTLATVGIMVFVSPRPAPADSAALIYAPMPLLLWAAVRFGIVGTCGSILFIGALAAFGVIHGAGPLGTQPPAHDLLSVVCYLVVASMPLLLLAAALEERDELGAARKTSEARMRALFENSLIPTAIWRSGGRIIDANDAFLRLTGSKRRDLDAGRLRTQMLDIGGSQPLAGGGIAQDERTLLLYDGRRAPVLAASYPLPGLGGEQVYFACDLSDTRHADEARRQAGLLHAAILASIHDQIVVLDAHGVVIEVNEVWRRFERAELRAFENARIGSDYLQACGAAAAAGNAMAADVLAGARDVLEGLSPRRHFEFSLDTSDGLLWFEISIESLRRREGGAVIIRSDITERKRAAAQAGEQRRQLALLGRAAVLGELSVAFAHELAQPLTSILGNAEAGLELLTRGPAKLPEVREILRDIIADNVRAADIIQRLRSMLVRGEIQRQPVDLNDVIREVLDLAQSDLFTRGVSISLRLDPNLPEVLADRAQLQQVVFNLVVNACESMSGASPSARKLSIATLLADDSYIQCSLSDRGWGIPPGDTERIFQPFVTTKKQGLGLGLAICRSLVEAQGGKVWAEHGADGGAVFRFTARIHA